MTTQAFLGLTVACARCHDHKFDPIPQRDYYALAGIFRSTETCYGTHPDRSRTNRRAADCWSCRPRRTRRSASGCSPTPGPTWSGSSTTMRARQREIARGGRAATQGNGEYLRLLTRIHLAEARLASCTTPTARPSRWRWACATAARPADSPLYARGELDKPGEVVPRGLPQVLVRRRRPQIGRRAAAGSSWPTGSASTDNPLTARVMVNRVWLHLFGRGLVPTPDNFGAGGPAAEPSRAARPPGRRVHGGRLVGQALIRRLVLSRAYQLGSRYDARNYEADPDNVLVWRMSQRRLEAEAVRDAMLAVSGQLEPHPPVGSPVARAGDGHAALSLRFGQSLDQLQRPVGLPAGGPRQPPGGAGRCSTSPTRAWSTGAGDDDRAGQGLYL